MRKAQRSRKTRETSVDVDLNLDGSGVAEVATGIGFLDHMLTLFAYHARVDLSLRAQGDLGVDAHHTTEDVGLVLGAACAEALGDKKGVVRYASLHLPMDEALTRVALDLSGRPLLVFNVVFPTEKIGTFDVELIREWFQAFASTGRLTLHVETLSGVNSHHIAESCFKGLGRALREAARFDESFSEAAPSTKGTLT